VCVCVFPLYHVVTEGLDCRPPGIAMPTLPTSHTPTRSRSSRCRGESDRALDLIRNVIEVRVRGSFRSQRDYSPCFLIRDAPLIGIPWWVTAAIMWIWHLRIRHRLRVSGL